MVQPATGYPPEQPLIPPPYPPPPVPPPLSPPRRGRLAVVIAVVLVLVLGGSAAAVYQLTRDTSKGQASPTLAVTGFLTAVYITQNATAASRYVCRAARDKAKLTAKINEIRAQDARYDSPRYTWEPPQTDQTRTDEAVLRTTVTLRTANEQVASQNLRIVTTRANGWWVCDINQVS